METVRTVRNPATDVLLAWFKGEFTAANAIIDALCQHLRAISGPDFRPEYDQVFAAIHRRRMNWIPTLQTQRYFSIAEVVMALRDATAAVAARRAEGQEMKSIKVVAAAPTKATDRGKEVEEDDTDTRKEVTMETVEEVEEEEEERSEGKPEEERSIGISAAAVEMEAAEEGENSELTTEEPVEMEESETQWSSNAATTDVLAEAWPVEQNLPAPGDLAVSGISNSPIALEDVHTSSERDDCNQRPARVRTTKGFSAKEPIDGHMVNVVKGLKLYDDIFIDQEVADLLAIANELRVAGQKGDLSGETYISFNKQVKGNKREMIQLGVPIFGQKDKPINVEPIPAAYEAVIDRLVTWRLLPEIRKPNCCIINYFDEVTHTSFSLIVYLLLLKGKDLTVTAIVTFHLNRWRLRTSFWQPLYCLNNIKIHSGSAPSWADPDPGSNSQLLDAGECSQPYLKPPHIEQPISTISLTSDCKMVFGRILMSDRHGNFKGSLELSLNEGSLVVMRGNSASTTHAICPSPNKRTTVTFVKVSAEPNNHSRQLVSSRKPLLARKMTVWQASGLQEKDKKGLSGKLVSTPRSCRAVAGAVPRWGVLHVPLVSVAAGWPLIIRRKPPPAGTGVFIPSKANSVESKTSPRQTKARDR